MPPFETGPHGRILGLSRLVSNLSRNEVLSARDKFEALNRQVDSYLESTDYDLLIDDERYPPKAIFGMAASKHLNTRITSAHFVGGIASPCFKTLVRLGFEIVKKGDARSRHYQDRVEESTTAPPMKQPRKRKGQRNRITPDEFERTQQRNQKLGHAGELQVLEHERSRLTESGREDLAAKVRHIAEEFVDAGYDILSFDADTGEEIYIEVKTTTQGKSAAFFISSGEVEFSEEKGDAYAIYRVYSFDEEAEKGKFYVMRGPVSDHFELTPKNYEALVK